MTRRRLSFSAALIALVALVAGVTGAVFGGLAWKEKRAAARALTEVAMAQAARLTAEHAARLFADTESAARLGPALVAEGLLDPGDLVQVEHYVIGILRAHPDLTWASYGDHDDQFVGARREPAGAIFLNRSFPRDGRIRLEEDRLEPDGRRTRVRTDDDHRYRPREQPYFRLAEAERAVAWTEAYRFYEGTMGMTCVAPVLEAGRMRGVFTVDISLAGLSRFVDALRLTSRSRVFITTADGAIMAGTPAPGDDAGLVASAVRALDHGAGALGHTGERLLGRAAAFTVGRRDWRVAVLVPETDLTHEIDAQARRAALIGGLGLLVAAGGGAALSRWIARPLRALGVQAQRVRDGDLGVAIVADSRDEIGTLARAMAEMVQGLRDRDFIRDVLGRYVSPDVAEQCLHNREALQLGGGVKTVSILMSDLRGFSALSERLGPEAMIGLLNRYFAWMVPIIVGHHGTINEFIGDAILVLFGAPVEGPDDAERAVRCAWAMQRAMAAFNAESRAAGLPELTMGIGLDSGRVVAGNIGSADRIKYGVVGPPVNLASRIESLTLGPQVLLSETVVARAEHVARVGPPGEVSLKGLAEPVRVFELLGITGEDEAPPRPALGSALIAVDLSAACRRVDGKRVLEPPFPVHVTRLGLSSVEFVAGADLPPDALDAKITIDFGDAHPSGGSYVRVAARHPAGPAPAAVVRVEAVFTALAEADRACIVLRLAA